MYTKRFSSSYKYQIPGWQIVLTPVAGFVTANQNATG